MEEEGDTSVVEEVMVEVVQAREEGVVEAEVVVVVLVGADTLAMAATEDARASRVEA